MAIYSKSIHSSYETSSTRIGIEQACYVRRYPGDTSQAILRLQIREAHHRVEGYPGKAGWKRPQTPSSRSELEVKMESRIEQFSSHKEHEGSEELRFVVVRQVWIIPR